MELVAKWASLGFPMLRLRVGLGWSEQTKFKIGAFNGYDHSSPQAGADFEKVDCSNHIGHVLAMFGLVS